ncbi:Maf family protein [Besnoitia besnoiti]|uniref:Maf family protein n=1 Tax=Besnoitia besnoiti TaxID=94643 RepID=A0A2A9MEN1_BESBE|nr:Maf family protein [Besnoitia besnoiti]PFH36329.1 Maf family protein [Besnoitia besnoiti]
MMEVADFFVKNRVILGSSSKWRRQVLERRGCPCGQISPAIDEKQIRHDDPVVLVTMLANKKADACLENLKKTSPSSVFPDGYVYHLHARSSPETGGIGTNMAVPNNSGTVLPSYPSWLICSDQVAVFRNSIREKPANRDEGEAFLRDYSGSGDPVQVINATVLVNSYSKRRIERIDKGAAWFRHIPDADIKEILDKGLVLACAGGFAIDDEIMSKYVERIDGEEECFMGLPMSSFGKLIEGAIAQEGGPLSAGVQKCARGSTDLPSADPRVTWADE